MALKHLKGQNISFLYSRLARLALPEVLAQRGVGGALGEAVTDGESAVTAAVQRVPAGVAHGGAGP